MNICTPIRHGLFTALALAFLAVACGDDRSPTELADQNRETPEAAESNPWTTILAAAETLGGQVTVSFTNGTDRAYRVGELDEGTAVPQDGSDAYRAVCVVEDARHRADLDAFRQCMARALREDICGSGGVFVLYRPNASVPGKWRALCPATAREEDEPEDDQSRVSHAFRLATARAIYG